MNWKSNEKNRYRNMGFQPMRSPARFKVNMDFSHLLCTEHGLEAHVTTTPFTGKLLGVCLGGLGVSGFDELNRVAFVFLFPASVPA